MVRFVVAVVRQGTLGQLLFSDIFEHQEVRLVLVLTVVKTTSRGVACRREKLLTGDRGSVCRGSLTRNAASRPLFLEISQLVEQFTHQLLSLFFLNGGLAGSNLSFFVHKVRSTCKNISI